MRGLGVDIVIQSDHPAIARRVRDAWRDAAVESPDSDARTVTVSFEPGADVHSPDINEIMHTLSPTVTREVIGAQAGRLVMLHAAALANPRTGAAAVLVAPSGTGKTTAAMTLGRTLAYLSDETAGITEGGDVLAYRKPLSVIESPLFKTQRAPSEMGLITEANAGRLAALYILERDHEHQGFPVVVALDTIDALAELAPQVSFLGKFDRPLQRLADLLHRAGGAKRVTYRDAEELAPLLARDLGHLTS